MGRTVAEQAEEVPVLLDRLLDAEHAGLSELVVQDPLAKSGLDDIGTVQTVLGVDKNMIQKV